MTCPTLGLAHLIGKKWTIVIMEEIAQGNFSGFNNVLKKSGLTPKILSDQLKEMESRDLIKRLDANPTSYKITQAGSDFRAIIKEIKRFSRKWGNSDDCSEKSCLECRQFQKSRK